MNTEQNCPKCGRPLTGEAPQDLCPRCLMMGGADISECPAEGDQTTVAGEPGALPPPANQPRPVLGTVSYFGDYQLLEEIARGGMGVVYKARQVSLNRTVAVKMILAGQLAGEAAVKRFRTEAQAAANLQHPNIVAIHEVGEQGGQHYFSMDFVEGKSLAEAARDNPLPACRSAELLRAVAEAVQYAHQRGILHRDLKPQNVLLDGRGQPRLTDFGLARKIEGESDLTATGAVMGSPSYMAPEQASGSQGEVGPATDVYGLGAILYFLLTGKPPFAAETAVETILKVRNEEAVPPGKLNPGLPADLETVCLKCLEKQPERRYPTARALVEDLDRFLKDEPVLAKPPTVLRKVASWSRRRPWVFVLALSVGLVLLLGAVFWLRTENEFLKFSKLHPEYSPQPGPMARRPDALGKKMAAVHLALFATMICVTTAMASIRKSENEKRKSGWFARNGARLALAATKAMGLNLFWHGILVVQSGIEARVWEGAACALPLIWGFGLVYIGLLYLCLKSKVAAPGGAPARCAAKQPASAEPRAKPDWNRAHRWRFTFPGVLRLVLFAASAGWACSVQATDIGWLVVGAFVTAVALVFMFHAIRWEVADGRETAASGVRYGLLILLIPVIVTVQFAAHLHLSLLGFALGVAGAAPLVEWRRRTELP